MNILGNGIDIVKNLRIKKAIKNKNFIKKILSNKEINNIKNKKFIVNHLAKRFAAKESLVKALGTGFKDGIRFKDISVLNDQYGKPLFILNDKLNKKIKKKFKIKKFNIFLSIADEKEYSVAYTIISGN
jgi:holo-[acyl-carrier protein] synthase|tara:strand:+ start:261 stop:647 length:387 start_codon:yes stop_codon:yes gene_type:complete